MELLEFEYNGISFQVYIEKEELEAVRKDPKRMEDLKSNAYKNYLEANIPKELDKAERSEDKEKSVEKKWTSEKTKLLISLRLDMEKEFTKPVCKKNKLWEKLAETFNKVSQSNYSGMELDTKYRNFLQTYRINKTKKEKSGEATITWEFFETFDKHLGNKASVAPPGETLGGSYLDTTPSTSRQETTDSSSGTENVDVNNCPKSETRKRKKDSMTMSQYLAWKINEKENENEYKKMKWEDTKKLKEKELSIFADLVKALKGKDENQ